jgi:surface antigen
VLAWGDREACRRSLYNGTAALSLCRQLRGFVYGPAAVAAVVSALGVSGCSYQLSSLVSKEDIDTQPTGSIAQPADQAVHVADASPPAEIDLAYTRAVASNVLARGGKDASVPWQNPQTGAGGNITPLATSYSEDGLPCRDFLASYVHGGSQEWLQGAACRTAGGTWEVKRLKPLKPS